MIPNFYAVILAGGSGTRFWPMSRTDKPKQFLAISGQRTLFEETLDRIKPVINPANVFVVTNKRFKKDILQQTKRFAIPAKNILWEPEGKNTAPAICWAASCIYRRNPQALMAVLPSDHLIAKKKEFLTLLRQALYLSRKGYLVTMGITPNRPETGYGYLQTKKQGNITLVQRFTEKPNAVKAVGFIKKGNYLWNSGMFFWKTSVILDQFRAYQPQIFRGVGPDVSDAQILRNWRRLPSISVDYAILEKAAHVAAVPAKEIGWSDLGSWESLWENLKKDKRGNVAGNDHLVIDCQNVLCVGEKRFVAALGLNDLVIVDTPDALLVCHKGQSQKIREVVDFLKKRKRKEV